MAKWPEKTGTLLTDIENFNAFQLNGLRKLLVEDGLDCPETKTVIQDWRINVFPGHYRRVDEPIFWGDLRIVGGIVNWVWDQQDRIQRCLQWKAGTRFIPSPLYDERFLIRIRVHDIPFVFPFIPLASLMLSLFALLIGILALFRTFLK